LGLLFDRVPTLRAGFFARLPCRALQEYQKVWGQDLAARL
jgi:hypothetical protein